MNGHVTFDVEGGGIAPNAYHSVAMLEQLLNEKGIPATLFITPEKLLDALRRQASNTMRRFGRTPA